MADIHLSSGSKTRNRKLVAAFTSSVVSKVGSLSVLTFALPLAISSLGNARYGAYATMVSGVSWVTLVSLGAGPGLTRALAEAAGSKDHQKESELFTNGLLVVIASALVMAGIISTIAFSPHGVEWLGASVLPYREEAHAGLALLALLVPLTVLFGLSDAMYSGYQDQYVTNMWSLVMSLLSLPAYLWVRQFSPTMPSMVLAAFGPPALTKCAGMLQLLLFKRKYLRFQVRSVKRHLVKSIWVSGVAFSVLSLGSYLNTQLIVWMTGQQGGEAAAQMGVLMQMFTLAITLITMGTGPLWPALIEAKRLRDQAWISKTLRLSSWATVVFALGCLTILPYFAPFLAGRWYHVALQNPVVIGWAFGLFTAAAAIENMLLMVSVGLGELRSAAKIFLVRSLVVALCYWPVLKLFGIPGLLVVAALSILVGPAWLMARRIHAVVISLGSEQVQ